MSVYVYSEQQIESIIDAARRFRLRFCIVAATILSVACVVALTRPEWIFGAHQRARMWVALALFVFFAGPLADTLLRGKSRPRKLEESLRKTVIAVSDGAVEVSGTASPQRLERREICYAEEFSWGLYLRTSTRYRWLMIPARIEGFGALKNEILRLHIPIVTAAIPPNWEEFVGVLIFIATMFCAIFARETSVLAANLCVSLLVAIGGFVVLSANPDNLPKMRWARFGIFLPVAMTASMLWMALHP